MRDWASCNSVASHTSDHNGLKHRFRLAKLNKRFRMMFTLNEMMVNMLKGFDMAHILWVVPEIVV